MRKMNWLFSLFLSMSIGATAQQTTLKEGTWRAALIREDGNEIVFNLEIQQKKGKTLLYVVNGEEKLELKDLRFVKDSLFADMPVFESSFKLKTEGTDSLTGSWVKRGTAKDQVIPITAAANLPYRFKAINGDATEQAGGKWKIDFVRGDNHEPAVGTFVQNGNEVRGSILTATGDYRFLAGTVTGNLLQVSTFDGVHAMVFRGKINNGVISEGETISGRAPVGKWIATKDELAALPEAKLTTVKEGSDGKLDFSFRDIDGKLVSITDKRFQNKVVVIQLMGSWCPNCMDETAFMSEYYKKNKSRGIEMVGLAYEYTTDEERSRASLRKFQKRFDVQYPLLISSATVSDPERTQKTLPQLTDIKVFPTTIILGKDGKVAEIETDFFGPGTGEYYTRYVEKFGKTIDELLKK
jgi:peroxiredoxin